MVQLVKGTVEQVWNSVRFLGINITEKALLPKEI